MEEISSFGDLSFELPVKNFLLQQKLVWKKDERAEELVKSSMEAEIITAASSKLSRSAVVLAVDVEQFIDKIF